MSGGLLMVHSLQVILFKIVPFNLAEGARGKGTLPNSLRLRLRQFVVRHVESGKVGLSGEHAQ